MSKKSWIPSKSRLHVPRTFLTYSMFVFLYPSKFLIVFRSRMNRGFRRQQKSPEQYIGLQVEYLCVYWERFNFCRRSWKTLSTCRKSELCTFWYSNLVLSSFLSTPRTSFLVLLSSHTHHSAQVSWRLERDSHLFATLEHALLGLGCCFSPISWRSMKQNSDLTFDFGLAFLSLSWTWYSALCSK